MSAVVESKQEIRGVGRANYITDFNPDVESAMKECRKLDFTKLNAKLESHYEWSKEQIAHIEDLYRKWLALHICYPNVALTPSKLLDEYWHMHILDTLAYTKDCDMLFGRYLHHYPYFGLEGDAGARDEGFELTKSLYKKHFNTELLGIANPCKSTDCR